jgi:hypothetical protein
LDIAPDAASRVRSFELLAEGCDLVADLPAAPVEEAREITAAR